MLCLPLLPSWVLLLSHPGFRSPSFGLLRKPKVKILGEKSVTDKQKNPKLVGTDKKKEMGCRRLKGEKNYSGRGARAQGGA